MSTQTATPLQGKVAIITGGSKGIRAATTHMIISMGANVVFSYSSNDTSADALVAKINFEFPSVKGGPLRVFGFKGDAGFIPNLKALVAKTLDLYSRIDILVLNAAIMPLQTLANTSEVDFDRHINLNLKGPFFLTQQVAPHLTPGSRIVFLSTSLTVYSSVFPAHLMYLTTKGTIELMVRVLAKKSDLAKGGITVIGVSPGPTATDSFNHGKSDAVLDVISNCKSMPMGRIDTPEVVAEVIGWLAGGSSRCRVR